MSQKLVFNGRATKNKFNLTDSLADVTAIYINAPDISDELDIDFYLQLAVSPSNNQIIPLTFSNLLNTLLVYEIPEEYRDTGFNIYGVVIVSFNVTLEIWGITKDISVKSVDEKIDILTQQIEEIQLQVQNINLLPAGINLTQSIENTVLSMVTSGFVPTGNNNSNNSQTTGTPNGTSIESLIVTGAF